MSARQSKGLQQTIYHKKFIKNFTQTELTLVLTAGAQK